ncbi:MAG: ATP-binding cassette domain-containing protein [Deltaproteobacteria bacterium]
MENLLEIKNLRVEFNTERGLSTAVRDVSLRVRTGETIVLAGESGSGKSVTAMAVTGLLPQEALVASGAIIFKGRDLIGLPEDDLDRIRGKEIAYIFQEPSSYLDPVYTIGEQIAETLVFHQSMKKEAARAEALRLLGLVRINEPERAARSYPHQLSGGMNQRVFIAIALACGPRLLIADEPTTSLDITIEDQIITLLCELKKKLGFSLLFITHNLAVGRRIADRMFIMHKGEVVEEGDVASIFGSPRHRHTKELIEAYERIGRIRQ